MGVCNEKRPNVTLYTTDIQVHVI